jgi:uncharacterized protein (UPF0333 family)
MFQYLRKKRAQSSLEYAILIIIVLGALLTIQVYIKRGIQGRLKSATDDIGDQYSASSMNYHKQTKLWSRTNETAAQADGSKSTLLDKEVSNTQLEANEIQGGDYWGHN